MGDPSPKNIQKLEVQQHEEHVKHDEEKHENAERQHSHPEAKAADKNAAPEPKPKSAKSG